MNLPDTSLLDIETIVHELQLVGTLFVQIAIFGVLMALFSRKLLVRCMYCWVPLYLILYHVIWWKSLNLESYSVYTVRVGVDLILLGSFIYTITSSAFLLYVTTLLMQYNAVPEDAMAFEGFARFIFRPFTLVIFTSVSLLCSRMFLIILLTSTQLLVQTERYQQLVQNLIQITESDSQV